MIVQNYKELLKGIDGEIITINPKSEPTYFNRLENVQEVDVDSHIDENIIPMINLLAQSYKSFSLSEPEVNKIKEIAAEGLKIQTNFNILKLRDELKRQNSKELDLSRVVDLLNEFL